MIKRLSGRTAVIEKKPKSEQISKGFAFLAGMAALGLTGLSAHAQQARPDAPLPVFTLPPITIVGASPLLGSGIDRDLVPAESTVLKNEDFTRGGTLNGPNLVRALDEQVSGVNLDSASGNPYQPTLFYHGFEASALQGTPQGLAVYVNGIRFNQAFGDTVNFDLLPDVAIDQINLEGSNPVFGLNAFPADHSAHSAAISSTANRLATRRFMSRPAACTRSAGATGNPRESKIFTAISAGAATLPRCMPTSCSRTRY